MAKLLEVGAFVWDEWMSRAIGRPVGRWVAVTDHLDEVQPLQNFAIATARVDIRLSGIIQNLLDVGFVVVERSLTLETRKSGEFQDSKTMFKVRRAEDQDMPDVVRIAGSVFSYDRFHQDKQVSTEIADRVKVEWVKSFFTGTRGREMLVAVDSRRSDKPVGFLLVADGPAGELVIDLMGVDRNHHRQGHATRLVHAFLNLPTNASIYRVGTQASNVESRRLYEKLGFDVVGESVSLHFHNPNFEVTGS